jgi:DNA-binding NarL/FixJ family response regulator
MNPKTLATWLSGLAVQNEKRPTSVRRRDHVLATASEPNLSALDGDDRANCLTSRELDVLRLLASGCTYCEAANRLGISPHTIVTHVKNAYRKLGVHSAAAAVMRAMQLGMFDESHNQAMVR